ncbi:NAD(P)-binding protein [Apiospora arundinis]
MSSSKVMRAWQYSSATGGLHKALALNTAAAHPRPTSPPKLAKNELLVRVRASSLQHMDHILAELPYGMSRLVVPPPASPVGDAVLGRLAPTRFGSLGEIVVAKANSCAPIPAGLSMVDASAIPSCGLTAYQCIVPYIPEAGEASGKFRIFIHGGSGGCGTFGIQIAKILGCHVTTSCSTRNVDLCKSLGADEVIDYTKGNLLESLKGSEGGFSLIVDNVGTPANLYKESDNFLLPQGTFVQVGADVSIQGTLSLTSRMLGRRLSDDAAVLARIAEWTAAGRMKSVFEVFEFADAPKAIERLQQRPSHGKVVVKGAD